MLFVYTPHPPPFTSLGHLLFIPVIVSSPPPFFCYPEQTILYIHTYIHTYIIFVCMYARVTSSSSS
uniref:Uncharacterized protein n=1 Tax=Helianthus annuus TaxID=4232 RepID=A0A251SVG5_HELAN